MSLPEDLRSIGLELVPRGKQFVVDCPFHTGGHNNDSVTVGRWKGKWFWKCFACGASGRDVHEWNTAIEIMRLRAERDEARREICSTVVFPSSPQEYAARRGWDCFKEDGK